MKALETTRQLLTSAGITGSLFALPLALALQWTMDLELPEVELSSPEPASVQLAITPDAAPEPEPAIAPAPEPVQERTAARATPRAPGPVRSAQVHARAAPVAAAAAPAAPRKQKKGRSCQDANPGIQRVDGGFAVDRSIVDAYAKKPSTLGALGWVSRHEGASGKADGYKLGGIQCGNDLHAAGLRNGDVVHSVNGKPVTSVPEALWAYTTLRNKDEIELRITRNGKPRILNYRMG